jgi:putative FmdB family regulatory protein
MRRALEYLMPLFEYECRGCHQQFEYLTRDGQSPSCPSCKGDDLQKLLSAFAVSTGGSVKSFDAPAGGCGTCGDPRGPGSCSMN